MRDKIHSIDAVRGLAACGVAFAYHFRYLTGDATFVHPAGAPLAWLPFSDWLYRSGDGLVDLFFVLSGFIFCHVYRPDAFPISESPRTFAVNRVARLYPLHLTTLACAGLLIALASWTYGSTYGNFVATPGQFALHVLMLNFGPVVGSYNAAAWSLSVECLCYLLFYIFGRQREPIYLALCATAVAAGLLLQQNLVQLPMHDWWFTRGLVGFFAGTLLFSAKPLLKRVPLWVLILATVAGFYLATANLPLLHHFSHFARLSLFAWVPAIALVRHPAVQPLADNRVAQWMGDHSFSIYLWHVPVAMVILLLNHQHPFLPEQWGSILAVHAIATLSVAALSYRYLERPAQKKLRRLAYVQVRSAPAANAA